MIQLPFEDRAEAGRLLGAELNQQRLSNAIVLALPRGGVSVGFEVAKTLHAPLDTVVVRKLGVPWQPELAMGAIAGGSFQVLDYEMIAHLGVSAEEIERVIAKERAEGQRREKLYRGERPAPDVHSRTVVLVDDGLATGSTMLVAVRYVRSLRPARLIVAVPVGSREACARVAKEVETLVCLAKPQPFIAVGEWYYDFRQVTDSEVQRMLEENQEQIDAAGGIERRHRSES